MTRLPATSSSGSMFVMVPPWDAWSVVVVMAQPATEATTAQPSHECSPGSTLTYAPRSDGYSPQHSGPRSVLPHFPQTFRKTVPSSHAGQAGSVTPYGSGSQGFSGGSNATGAGKTAERSRSGTGLLLGVRSVVVIGGSGRLSQRP